METTDYKHVDLRDQVDDADSWNIILLPHYQPIRKMSTSWLDTLQATGF